MTCSMFVNKHYDSQVSSVCLFIFYAYLWCHSRVFHCLWCCFNNICSDLRFKFVFFISKCWWTAGPLPSFFMSLSDVNIIWRDFWRSNVAVLKSLSLLTHVFVQMYRKISISRTNSGTLFLREAPRVCLLNQKASGHEAIWLVVRTGNKEWTLLKQAQIKQIENGTASPAPLPRGHK